MKRSLVEMACVLAVAALAALLLPAQASARTATIPLQRGWNMISFPFEPDDPTSASVVAELAQRGTFQALWAYDAASGEWSRFPSPAGEVPELSRVEVGRGYWIRVSQAETLVVDGTGQAANSEPMFLRAGWNLVGFPLESPETLARVIAGLPVRRIFRFQPNASAGSFEGVDVDALGDVDTSLSSFQRFEPGRGYWLFLADSAVIAPLLGTSAPADVDLPPLVGQAVAPGVPVPFDPLSAGDVDIGRDGFLDRPQTQRALDLGDSLSSERIAISNAGTGALGFTVAVDDPGATPWLGVRAMAALGEAGPLLPEVSGTAFSDGVPIEIVADRSGLPVGRHTGSITVFSTGVGVDPFGVSDRARTFTVAITVPPLDGDYRVQVELDTLEGRPASLPKPTLLLSVYEDQGELKAAIDDTRTILFPRKVRLSGRQFEAGTSRFTLSGTLAVAPGGLSGLRDPGDPEPFNPYSDLLGTAGPGLRRDVSLVADRPGPGAGDALGLVGEYRETIRNVLPGKPITLAGRFVAERVSASATAQDRAEASLPGSASLRDGALTTLAVEVSERLRITDVDVELDVVHARPDDLRISLTSPAGTTQFLIDRNLTQSRRLRFDQVDTPVGELSVFDGEASAGTWTLNVEDLVSGEAGALDGFRLIVRGTEVHSIVGPVSNAPAGTLIVLSGCGITRSAVVTAGSYRFDGVVDCVYNVTAFADGRAPVTTQVAVAGADATAQPLAPAAAAPGAPGVLPLQSDGIVQLALAGTSFMSGSTDPSFGGENAFDSATFDLNRAPAATSVVGREDTDAFGALEDPLRRSNVIADPPNGVIDPPAGARSFRVAVAIGAPISGASVSGDVRLGTAAAVLSEGRR